MIILYVLYNKAGSFAENFNVLVPPLTPSPPHTLTVFTIGP